MKKVIFSFLIVLFSGKVAVAQSVTSRIEVGANFANMNFSNSDTPNIKVGLRLGGAIEVGLTDGIYLAPGLLYRSNGFEGAGGSSATLHYLSLPVNLGYRVQFSPSWSASVEAGPYFAYGIGGKINTNTYWGKIDAFGDTGDFNRFEAGLGVSATLGYDRYSFRLGTELGLSNISKTGDVRNNAFYFGLGVRF